MKLKNSPALPNQGGTTVPRVPSENGKIMRGKDSHRFNKRLIFIKISN
jgi:hypothetical protein